jgi:hypothetical protein
MGAIVFFGAVAGLIAGATALDRLRRKRLHEKLEQGSLKGDHVENTPHLDARDNPSAAEGSLRGGQAGWGGWPHT